MSLSPDQVSAVIVTRGNVDLAPVLATLPYKDVVIWDNGSERCYRAIPVPEIYRFAPESGSDQPVSNLGVNGRYAAIQYAKHEVIYMQDDDLLFTAHDELLAQYEGELLANMPSPWYEAAGYEAAGCLLVGGGALMPRRSPREPFRRYLARWPCDDLFLTYCDFVHGILTPGRRVDLGYEVLPHAHGPDRIVTAPGAQARKQEVMRRALELRG